MRETGEYCERLKDMDLNFIAEEKIAERTHEFGKTFVFKPGDRPRNSIFFEDLKITKTKKNSYLYDYQMIKKG